MIKLVALCVWGRCFSYLCLVERITDSSFLENKGTLYNFYFQFVLTLLYVFLNKIDHRTFGYDLLSGEARQQLT